VGSGRSGFWTPIQPGVNETRKRFPRFLRGKNAYVQHSLVSCWQACGWPGRHFVLSSCSARLSPYQPKRPAHASLFSGQPNYHACKVLSSGWHGDAVAGMAGRIRLVGVSTGWREKKASPQTAGDPCVNLSSWLGSGWPPTATPGSLIF
jgi:hypothetical protein